jgi:hypothetical protein
MFQKGRSQDQFFNMKALAPRPLSEATDMSPTGLSDTDFEDDESEIEEADSPRLSLNSVGRPHLFRCSLLTPRSLVGGARRHYHPLKKSTHQAHMTSRALTLT